MGDLESTRQRLEGERRQLTEARDLARDAARAVRERSHSLALTLESQRAQLASLSQALERMGTSVGSWIRDWASCTRSWTKVIRRSKRCRPNTRTRWKSACAPIAC